MTKQLLKKAARATNAWFGIGILGGIIFIPIDLLFHKQNNLLDLFQLLIQFIRNHSLIGIGLIIGCLAAGWLIIFLVIYFFCLA
ncbi:hypothetical protein [Lentilactobacillus kisonensis]|uniref:hypothetical protein n=1 Tax=Lentilactobacillus kisonensis TaxID=481722 RepID=UPI0006D11084|nr:hypothetical protein [Lentilactobacillus kisonensis]